VNKTISQSILPK